MKVLIVDVDGSGMSIIRASRRQSLEQIVCLLAKADHLPANGEGFAFVRRTLVIPQSSLNPWRAPHDAMNIDDAKRIKGPEAVNMKLKRLLVDSEVEKVALKETDKGKWESASQASSGTSTDHHP